MDSNLLFVLLGKMKLFNYSGKVVKVVDGDTVDVMLDLGFNVFKKVRCRLNGINSPELKTKEGKKAKDFLSQQLPIGTNVLVESKNYDKYGRSVAIIFKENVNINKLMLESGYATEYKN